MGVYARGKVRFRTVFGSSVVLLYAGLILTVVATARTYMPSPSEQAVTTTVRQHLSHVKQEPPILAAVKPVPPTPAVLGARTAATPPETALGVYVGPGSVAPLTTFEKWLGAPVPYTTDYIDYKGGWQKDFVDSKTWLIDAWAPRINANSQRRLVLGVPMLEIDTPGGFVAAIRGDFDQYFQGLAINLVGAKLGGSIIRLGYEANCNTIGPWQATDNPGAYKRLFRHIVSVMRAVPGASFSFDWTVCNGLQAGHALNSFASFYPGDDLVDIMGMDLYDVKWQDASVSAQRRWEYERDRRLGIADFLSFAAGHQKPVSYPEWGLYKSGDSFAGGGDNPLFVQKMYELIQATHPVYQSYFDLDWGGGTLQQFPHGAALYRQLFGGATSSSGTL